MSSDHVNKDTGDSSSVIIAAVVSTLVGTVILTMCYVLNVPSWLLVLGIIAFIAVVIASIVWALKRDKRKNYARSGKLARLLAKAIKQKTGEKPIDKLERDIIKACEGDPEAWKGFKMLGELYLARESRNRAKDYFLKAESAFTGETPLEEKTSVWNDIGGIALLNSTFEEAVNYFRKASASDNYKRGLGIMYAFGWGVKADLKVAEELFCAAARAWDTNAVQNLYEVRWRMTVSTSDETVQGYLDYMRNCYCGRGYRQGVYALKESARKGYAPAQYELGTLYQNMQYGEDRPGERKKEAFRYLRMGAEQGYLPAIHNLGILIQQDIVDPVKGDIYAPKVPGSALYDTEVVKFCSEEGHKLIIRAAEAGYAPSQHSIAIRYLFGSRDALGIQEYNLVPKDEQIGMEWLKKAIRQGYKPALDTYGGINYLAGITTESSRTDSY